MSDIRLLLSVVIPLVFMFVCIKKKVSPVLFTLGAAILTCLIGGIPLGQIPGVMSGAFGEMMTNSAYVIIFGIIYGELMDATGGLSALLNRMVKHTGANGSVVSVFVFGYVLSIPVGFPAAMAVGCPMLKTLSHKTKLPLVTFASAFIPSSFTTSSLVIPTLTPVLVCGLVGANLGWSFVYSIIASLIAAAIGCLGWAFLMAKLCGKVEKAEDFHAEIVEQDESDDVPSSGVIVGLIALPIALILLGTILPQLLPATNPIVVLFSLIGNTSFALIISILVELVVLRKYLKSPMRAVEAAVSKCGMNLVLTGLAGAIGTALLTVGVGDMLLRYTADINIPVLALAYLITLLIRLATGVTTVAATTVAPLLLPMVTSMGVSPVLYAMAICFGCVGPALPNDGSFWMYKNFTGMTTKETVLSFTVPTAIVGVVGLVVVLGLGTLTSVLPGLL